MKKTLIIATIVLIAFAAKAQNRRGFKVEAFDLLQAHKAFVISNDTLYNTTQLSSIDTTLVTKLWALANFFNKTIDDTDDIAVGATNKFDETVSIIGAGINNVTGTYPNFTITGTEVDGSITNELQDIENLAIDGSNILTVGITDGTDQTVDLSQLSGGGSGGASFLDTITLTAHGYAVGDVIDYSAKALASNMDSANVIGIVYEVIDANTFSYQYAGVYPFGTWVVGMNYFLSTTVEGTTADTTQLYGVDDVYLFLGTGVENGLLLTIDVGYLIEIDTSTNITSSNLYGGYGITITQGVDSIIIKADTTELAVTETDPIWTADKTDYFNKTTDDSGDIIEGTNFFYTEARVTANTAVAANTAKETNATHTGEVTGSTALTITDDVVDAQNLEATNEPTVGYVPAYEAGGGFTWTASGGSSSTYSGASATTNADRTINGAIAALPFGAEEWDTNDYHDKTTNNTRITVSENGYYRILFNTNFDFLNSVLWYSFSMFKNGIQIREWRAGQDELWDSADYESVSITIDLNLTSSDYIEIKCICDRNTGAIIYSGDAVFQIQKL